MELYIISEDLFLISGLRSTLIFGLSLVKNILPIEALVKKYNAQSLLIIDTRVNLDEKFYSSLSKKEVAVIFLSTAIQLNRLVLFIQTTQSIMKYFQLEITYPRYFLRNSALFLNTIFLQIWNVSCSLLYLEESLFRIFVRNTKSIKTPMMHILVTSSQK
ncbi:hypothetical protein [Klebsiella aerogenes]|uniref:hypothetical protein n=1 Tax=Klebsiella aerogenes TaxID=548 RepID=UPI002D80C95A|nr:hypothetical protein [Klebsiella aerogenes]